MGAGTRTDGADGILTDDAPGARIEVVGIVGWICATFVGATVAVTFTAVGGIVATGTGTGTVVIKTVGTGTFTGAGIEGVVIRAGAGIGVDAGIGASVGAGVVGLGAIGAGTTGVTGIDGVVGAVGATKLLQPQTC
jgi:hypothetical protein